MTRMIGLILMVAAVVTLAPERVQAQPSRQMPGTRPYLPGTPPINSAPLNPRTQPAAQSSWRAIDRLLWETRISQGLRRFC